MSVEYLFGTVPAGIFRVFAGSARSFFAGLLTHLADDPFGQAGEIATRKRVYASIGEFIDRSGRAEALDMLLGAEEGGRGASRPAGTGHVAAYNRLVETGWLVEYRDRYRKVVDFDPSARLVLHTLLDIQNGRVRSYGGAVLNVLTLLQSVEADRAAKALNVREAALAARGFMNHLRTVAGSMRRVEALIMAQPTAARLIRSFVQDFIEATIVQDYRNLQARDSPYRFRGQIIEIGERLIADDAALDDIARGWIMGGIARDQIDARVSIVADLREAVRVFSAIDEHVQDIETTTWRIERRITNVVRFTDRLATVSTDRILAAIELFSQSSLRAQDDVETRPHILLGPPPLDASHLYLPPKKRAPPAERVVEIRPPDPALERYLRAVDAFQLRLSIGPEKLANYVAAALGDKSELASDEFPVTDLDEFLAFERLHEIALGPLADIYCFEAAAGVTRNAWIERWSFVIRKREADNG